MGGGAKNRMGAALRIEWGEALRIGWGEGTKNRMGGGGGTKNAKEWGGSTKNRMAGRLPLQPTSTHALPFYPPETPSLPATPCPSHLACCRPLASPPPIKTERGFGWASMAGGPGTQNRQTTHTLLPLFPHLACGRPLASPPNEDGARVRVGKHGRVDQALVVDEFVALARLDQTVDQQRAAEGLEVNLGRGRGAGRGRAVGEACGDGEWSG